MPRLKVQGCAGHPLGKNPGDVWSLPTAKSGFSAAARSLPAHEHITIHIPDLQDEAAVYRAIARARYLKINLDDRSARLIAAHLQRGPGSALYRLAVTGEVVPSALDELDVIGASDRPYLRRWAAALRNYCAHRPDLGDGKGAGDSGPLAPGRRSRSSVGVRSAASPFAAARLPLPSHPKVPA